LRKTFLLENEWFIAKAGIKNHKFPVKTPVARKQNFGVDTGSQGDGCLQSVGIFTFKSQVEILCSAGQDEEPNLFRLGSAVADILTRIVHQEIYSVRLRWIKSQSAKGGHFFFFICSAATNLE
jgi:hypothetical protein